jgi:hypothetical protein
MAGKGTTWSTQLLQFAFTNTAVPWASNAAMYLSLHTADPGPGGSQSTSETVYTGYARVAVNRTTAGWTVTNSSVSPTSAVTFPACTANSGTITFFGIGTNSSGTGTLLYSGAISPTLTVSSGVTPQLTTATILTES